MLPVRRIGRRRAFRTAWRRLCAKASPGARRSSRRRPRSDEINTSLAYGFGFDFCGIEIDRDTGEIRIDKYVTSHDCGTILNPGLADGQIHGSFAAAIGASLVRGIRLCRGRQLSVRHLRRLPRRHRRRNAEARDSCIRCHRRRRSRGSAPKELPRAISTAPPFVLPTPSPMRLVGATSRCRSSRRRSSNGWRQRRRRAERRLRGRRPNRRGIGGRGIGDRAGESASRMVGIAGRNASCGRRSPVASVSSAWAKTPSRQP